MSAEPLLAPGLVLLDRYRVDALLARGGFGEVYRAFDLRIERDVALKYVFYKLDLETLRNEVTILARNAERLKFIPNIYDHWPGSGDLAGYFIVMEFIEGTTLDKYRRLPWPSDEVVAFLGALLRNLRDLHRSNIIHCDIKPVNIKAIPPSDLSYQVPYRILDFGIAKQGDQTTIRASTPHYAAPEQQPLGEVRLKIDQRADLYSLAATAYFLLTGKRPPSADHRYANVYEHRYLDPLKPPSSLVPGVPWALEQTLLEMLQIDRDRRPVSAEEALLRLEQRLAAGEPPTADQASQATDPATRLTAPPAPAGEHGAPLVTELTDRPLSNTGAPAADITPAALPLGPAPAPPPAAPEPAPHTRQPTAPERLAPLAGGAAVGHTSAGAPAPAPAAEPDGPGAPALVELERHGDGAITAIAWAPDSQALVVGTSLGLYRLPAQGAGRALWRPTAAPVRKVGYVLGGDGLLVASDRVEIVADDGRAARPALAALGGALLTAPAGQAVASLDDTTLRVFDLATGAETAAWRLSERIQGQVVALAADGRSVVIGDGDRLWWHGLGAGARGQRSIAGLPQPLVDLTLTPAGETVAIANPTTILVWSVGEEGAQTLIPEQSAVARLALTGDGRTLAVATGAQVSLRRAADGKTLTPLAEAELAGVAHMAFSPDDRLLAAASPDELRVWSLRDGALLRREAGWAERGHALAPLPGGGGLVALGPQLRCWSLEGGRLVAGPPLAGVPAGPASVAVSPDGALLACAGAGGLQAREREGGRERYSAAGEPAQAECAAFSADGERLLVATHDAVAVVRAATGEALAERPLLDRRAVEHVALAPAMRAAVQSAGRVVVVDLAEGGEHCSLPPRPDAEITAVALSADGALLAVAHTDRLALWQVAAEPARRLDERPLGPGPAVQRLAFDPAGERLVALRGPLAELWAARGDELLRLGVARGHTDRAVAAAALAGELLATASLDGTLRLWGPARAGGPTPEA